MHPAEPQAELLQCFDEMGQPTEARPRAEVKQWPPRWWYAVARIWLVNDKGQIMCSKRSELLSGNPGKWQTYFGGHVGAGVTIKETAQRELAEEAGIERELGDFHLIIAGHDSVKKVFFESYAVLFNGEPSDLDFSDQEVTEAKWMDMETAWKERQEFPDVWCNGCDPENQEKIREWLRATK